MRRDKENGVEINERLLDDWVRVDIRSVNFFPRRRNGGAMRGGEAREDREERKRMEDVKRMR